MTLLITQYYKSENDEVELSQEEMDICSYISQNNEDNYDQLISEDPRWNVFLQLTRLRKSLLNWYDFKPGSTLLEIGGGFGALTGLLCDHCAEVVSVEESLQRAKQIEERHKNRTNLKIYAANIKDIPLDQKFDYITLIGLLEFEGKGSKDRLIYSDFLRSIGERLKPGGKLIIAVENRFGLKYLCGAPDPYYGIPFAQINQSSYKKGTGYSFSKQELTTIIENAGYKHFKFYYPLPDYRLPQLIYSEKFIPKTSLKERLTPYYIDSSSLLAYENDLYDDVIENNALEFVANSFLVECSLNDMDFCNVIYAAVSTDRGRRDGFATTIHSDGNVKKTPLYSEGLPQLQNIKENHDELESSQLKVIRTLIKENRLVMPYVAYDTLSDYLKLIIRTNPEEFILLFDQLYNSILQSSTKTEHMNPSFHGYNDSLDYGVILEKAYIDMIPVNCFHHDNELIFFDQEFVKEHYPAKYVLFRALKYTYFFIQDAERYIPLGDMQERYGLNHLWEEFEKEEYNFVSLNRKYNEYHNFLKRTYIDRNGMRVNAKKLLKANRKND
ncbi:hypothetical protein C0Q44_08600 [Paenibacillus sp. PCH8]|uniref:SAM-dependent methyltransferase n=1 Tax=Paenibacillus sp. PCH8 TaxID=2066524 RepID=UPI000CFA2EDC|nr:class I SAM-dependent methyltransferase [Paenibacillus sp. PCH8]PQP84600.1 hypothetical protein C0Q44_08600 [Paenibacillus sp. PCH8]